MLKMPAFSRRALLALALAIPASALIACGGSNDDAAC